MSFVAGQRVIHEWGHGTGKRRERLMWVFDCLTVSTGKLDSSRTPLNHFHSANSKKKNHSLCSADLAALLSLAQQHIPGARLVEELGREAVINLPQLAAKDSSLGLFLSELDQRMMDLGISSYGLSDSTLEEVSAGFKRKGRVLHLQVFHVDH